MARKFDSGWRDARLALVHSAWDIPLPAAGVGLPMVEYDRGEALAVINYMRRDAVLPMLSDEFAAYKALGSLHRPDGPQQPFLTALYDPRNWAMRLFGHNDSARDLIGADGWVSVTEEHFVRLLYRLRGRKLPVLSSYGIELSTAPWMQAAGVFQTQGWTGQDVSERRRAYEPEGPGVRFNMRNPCADVDLAVIGRSSGQVSLVVDYKLTGAHIDPSHKTHKAMSNLYDANGNQVPSLIAQYDPQGGTGDGWRVDVLALNATAQLALYNFMTRTNAVADTWSGDVWTYMDERRWVDFLEDNRQR